MPAIIFTLFFIAACSSKTGVINDNLIIDEDVAVDWVDAVDTADAVDSVDVTADMDNADGVDETAESGEDSDNSVDVCSKPVEVPNVRIYPVFGELFYAQIGLSGITMGEAAAVIGPDGTMTAIDLGNDSHSTFLRGVLGDIRSHMNGAAGYPFQGKAKLDNIIITHYHADHADGLKNLLKNESIAGHVFYRGMYDITAAAGDTTVQQVCETLLANPGLGQALCEGSVAAPCTGWTGTYPISSCSGLGASIALGSESVIEFIGADGVMNGHIYEKEVAPLLSDDVNGENARSIAGVIKYGKFRMIFAGDLTGGGSDTDPVEGFYIDKIAAVSDIDTKGVDILHAGHHGRNTSNSEGWINRLIPNDTASKNFVIGISPMHTLSPYQTVIDTVSNNNRLKDGRIWTTTVATGGGTSPLMINANNGMILVSTVGGGDGYIVQAIDANGNVLETRGFHSIKKCGK